MKIINDKDYTPNILHFHGMNKTQLQGTFNTILENHIIKNNYDKERLSIVSTWTDEESCCLYQQCKNSGIEIINCVPEDYDRTQEWYMPNKIKFFIDVLEHTNKEIILFLDGYDVLITHLDDILERFESQKYRVLFGPSCNNYPDIKIDRVYGRANKGVYCFFNAGCVIGYREDLLKFYKQAYEYININNPYHSEQFILRIAYSKYSYDKNQDFVGVDFDCKIFQSMGMMDTNFSETEVLFHTNKETKNSVLVIKEYFDINDYSYLISKKTINELLTENKVENTELLEYVMENKMINYILFEVTDTPKLNEIIRILTIVSDKYEAKCYFVFNKEFDKKKINIIAEKYKNNCNYFITDSNLEDIYNAI